VLERRGGEKLCFFLVPSCVRIAPNEVQLLTGALEFSVLLFYAFTFPDC